MARTGPWCGNELGLGGFAGQRGHVALLRASEKPGGSGWKDMTVFSGERALGEENDVCRTAGWWRESWGRLVGGDREEADFGRDISRHVGRKRAWGLLFLRGPDGERT